MGDAYQPPTTPGSRVPASSIANTASPISPSNTGDPSAISDLDSSSRPHIDTSREQQGEGVAEDEEGDGHGAARPLTTMSSSATLCHWSSDEDEYFGRHKTKDSIDHPATIDEAPVPSLPSQPAPQQAAAKAGSGVPTASARRPSVRDRDDVPPPIHGPDVIAYLDPASSGGGGPLKRITTQQRERAEAEARERADRAHREALGIPEPEGQATGGILGRLRSGSNARRRRPSGTLADHPEEERFRPTLPTSWSTNTLAASAISDDDGDKVRRPQSTTGFSSKAPSLLQVEEQSVEYVYPDGGYGWVVVVCCMTLAGCTLGQGMNYGAYQTYYMNVAFPGASTAYVSIVGTINAFFMNFAAFFFGRMGDRFGYKRILYIGTFLFWLANFIASWCSTLWLLLLFQGAMAGLGQGMAVPLFMSLPSQWFYKRRGLASGLALSGAGLGGGTSLLVVRQLLATVGYHKTLLIMSFVNLFFCLLAIFFARTRPASPEASGGGRGPWVDKTVVKSSGFWSIAISLIVGTLGYGACWSYLQQWTLKNIPDIDPALAVVPATLLSYSLTFGRGLVGGVSDLLGPLNTYILCFTLSAVIQLSLWYTAHSFAQICAFGIIYGLVAPGFLGLIPQMVVQLFGPSNLATNVGLLILFNGPGNMAGPPLAGVLYDRSGRTSFKTMIIMDGCLQFGGAAIALWARYKTSRKPFIKV